LKIVIAGAGEVGYHLIENLYRDYPDITVIDTLVDVLEKLRQEFAVHTELSNIVDCSLFSKHGMEDVDLFLAITNFDETNMIACKMAKEAGASTTVCRIRQIDLSGSQQKQTLTTLGIDVVINPVELVANELTRLSLMPNLLEVHPFLNGDLQLYGYKMTDYSSLIGKTCKEIQNWVHNHIGELVLILRNERSIVPTPEQEIQLGDHVYFLIQERIHSNLREYLGFAQYQRGRRRIFINGGGHIGLRLAHSLDSKGYEIKVIEINQERSYNISEKLQSSLVLNFDGLDKNQLLAEGIEEADAFFSVTNNEELNITACMMARHLGVDRTLALVKQPEMLAIVEHATPIGGAISPRMVTARHLTQYIKGTGKGTVVSIAHVEIQEIILDEDTPCLGQHLKDLDCPSDLRVVMVKRGHELIIPTSTSKLQNGDHIILSFHHMDRSISQDLFSAQRIN